MNQQIYYAFISLLLTLPVAALLLSIWSLTKSFDGSKPDVSTRKNCELGGKRAKHDKTDLTSLQKIWATIFSLLPSSSSCSPSEPCPAPGVKFENKIYKCETHPSWSSTALHLFHHVLKTTHACKITFSRLSTWVWWTPQVRTSHLFQHPRVDHLRHLLIQLSHLGWSNLDDE